MGREYELTIDGLFNAQRELAADQRVSQQDALSHCLQLANAERLEALVEEVAGVREALIHLQPR